LFELSKVGKPDLDKRPDPIFDPGGAGEFQGSLVTLPHLDRIRALFQAIVTLHQGMLDLG
jgi:hypothetical protein